MEKRDLENAPEPTGREVISTFDLVCKILLRLARWFLFSVLVALVPLFCVILDMRMTGTGHVTWESVFGRGELILISAALAAAAIGNVLGSGKKLALLKVLGGAGCMIPLMMSGFWFANLSQLISRAAPYNQTIVVQDSLTMFIITMIATGACEVLAVIE